MTVILCLEDKGGMSFGGKRLSSDKLISFEIMKNVGDKNLFVKEYSLPLFTGENISVINDFSNVINTDDFCFIEKFEDLEIIKSAEKVIVYHFNRRYPFDKCFDFNLLSGKELISTRDFLGNSHPKITEEIYK